MDFNRLISLFTKLFLMRAVTGAIRGSRKATAGGGKAAQGKAGQGGAGHGKAAPSAADQAQAHNARELAKRARKAARVTRRLGT